MNFWSLCLGQLYQKCHKKDFLKQKIFQYKKRIQSLLMVKVSLKNQDIYVIRDVNVIL